MMLSKPEEEKQEAGKTSVRSSGRKAPADAVADLERRLAELSAANPMAPAAPTAQSSPPPAFAQPLSQTQEAPKHAAATGKNALLARIMAAQDRAKQAKASASAPAAPPAYADAPPAYTDAPPAYTDAPPAYNEAPDLLNFDIPSSSAPPPPAFDMSLLPPPAAEQSPPPAFDDSLLPFTTNDPMPSSTFNWDPHTPAPLLSGAPTAPPTASAPLFEDLMDAHPPPMQHWEPMAPPPMDSSYTQQQQQQQSDEDEAIAAILAIEGLSTAEKETMIAEQRKILASIERKKANSQFSAADAFEQRSLSAAVGANRSRTSAPMQDAGLDFMTEAEREQMKEDMKLAEQLQKMEYEEADQQTQQRKSEKRAEREKKKASETPQSQPKKKEQGWMEWLGVGGATAAPAAAAAAAKKERERMLEEEGLSVAGQQPLFACVTDSISSATTYAMNTNYLEEDDDGHLNGVDSSGLLAVTQVGRNKSG